MNIASEPNPIDVTDRDFEAKKKGKLRIKDDEMNKAAGYAVAEAFDWYRTTNLIMKNNYNNRLKTQICVCALVSIELYLKSILFNMGINVTEENIGHDIYFMYKKLDEKVKNDIQRDVKVDYEIKKNILNEVVLFNSFEEELQYIANDFVYLRYEYEKILNHIGIITPTNFILSVLKNIQQVALCINSLNNKI